MKNKRYNGGKMKKKITCPKCKSKNIIELFYGPPTPEYDEKTMKLMGCFYSPGRSPLLECRNCGKKFGEFKAKNKTKNGGRPEGKKPENRRKHLTDDEFNRFFAEASNNLKLETVFKLGFCFGMRSTEIAQVKLEDIDFIENTIIIRGVKGGRTRKYQLPDFLQSQLKNYLEKRGQIRNEYLFPHKFIRGKHITEIGLQKTFKYICEKTGIEGFSLHSLRHTCAVQQVQNGATAIQVMKWLRHRTIASAQVYFENFEDEEYEKEMTNKLNNKFKKGGN